MSTTTNNDSMRRRAARFTGAALLVTASWFTALAITTLVAEPTHSVAVFGPQERMLQAVIRGDALLIDSGSGYLVVRGQHAGFVRALYAGGALLVLPASSGGCRGRPQSARAS